MANLAFLGSYPAALDDRGRFALPRGMRSGLAHGAVLARGHDRCLYVYPTTTFELVARRLAQLPLSDRAGRGLVRMVFSAADSQLPDRLGRLQVPAGLAAYASLSNACIVVGVNTRIEVWEPARWDRYQGHAERQYEGIDRRTLTGAEGE